MKTVLYKRYTEWKLVDKKEKNKTGRTIVKLIIGHIEYDPDNSDYLIEDIFEDILNEVLNNTKEYLVYEHPGYFPKVVITNGGRLVIHNDEVRQHKKHIEEKLKEIPQSTLMNAYYEMRINEEFPRKLAASTYAMVSFVNENSDVTYATPFIYAIIKDMFEEKYFCSEENDIKEYVRSLDYEDLLKLINDCIGKRYSGETDSEFIKNELDNGKKLNDIENEIAKEVLYRLYIGTIRKGK